MSRASVTSKLNNLTLNSVFVGSNPTGENMGEILIICPNMTPLASLRCRKWLAIDIQYLTANIEMIFQNNYNYKL